MNDIGIDPAREQAQKRLLAEQLSKAQKSLRDVDDHWRPTFHLSPPVGLLNDPNGLVYHQGKYHMFYQWNPFACAHGTKFWGHVCSPNLVDWQHQPVALMPAQDYESHGCYSGSAVSDGGRLWLFYTGNVKCDDGRRESWQCLAEWHGKAIIKHGPLFGIPEGYTRHIRDPKVWQQPDGQWLMVLGAQTEDEQGRVLLYRSEDMRQWTLSSELAGSHLGHLDAFGYMWECPDLFDLGQHTFLIACPQGLVAEAERYQNVHQCGYFAGHFDPQIDHFIHSGFTELDNGFEFYAPQTFLDHEGRRLLIGWMGVPDQDELTQPTINRNWVHMMTMPRELINIDGRIHQHIPQELLLLRSDVLLEGEYIGAVTIAAACEWRMKVNSQPFQLTWRGCAELLWDGHSFQFRRLNWASGQWQERVVRPERLDTLQLFHDHSSLEIFVNGGEYVMSGRIFPKPHDMVVDIQTSQPLEVTVWCLRSGFPSPMDAARASNPLF